MDRLLGRTNETTGAAWYARAASDVAAEFGVDVVGGLDSTRARDQLAEHGPNRLAGGKKESALAAFVRQYRDFMQVVLLVAAIVNLVVTGDAATSLVLAGLTVFNAVVGLRQEAKAEESVRALATMMRTIARVRRDGRVLAVDAEKLVPGDVVLLEAGDRVPADGRLVVAATLEVEEAALTGESLPVGKSPEPVVGGQVPLGDRTCMVFMNTAVTRVRGELVVTATGMDTEIGHIAHLLAATSAGTTPLQRQLDGLSKVIAAIAAAALVLVVLLGLVRGESFDTLFITGVALAVAAIPTGLPAVVTALLSIGTREIARRGAIVRRLPAVETLGATSVICSDKTGTLTLNKMTARQLVVPGQHRFTVSGEGYRTDGEIRHVGGGRVVLAAKGGLDITETRRAHPRIAEVPFDSAYKFMATFHDMTDARGNRVVRCYVKGAPDVLIALGAAYLAPDGTTVPITVDNRELAVDANDRIAQAGERVMVVAQRDLDPASFDRDVSPIGHVRDLTLLAMVGIVDPPRPEARAAIAQCRAAGIRVRMITGDHATTAAEPTGGLMRRAPRPVGAAVLAAGSWVRLCVQGLVMTAGALVAYQIGDAQGGPVLGATALLTALSLFHLAAGLLSRDQRDTIFRRAAIPGSAQLRRYGVALLAIPASLASRSARGIGPRLVILVSRSCVSPTEAPARPSARPASSTNAYRSPAITAGSRYGPPRSGWS